MQLLAQHSLEHSTRRSYGSYLKRYFTYCARFAVDPLQPTYMEIAYFLAWLFDETNVSGGTAARCLTAVNHYLADNFIDWQRPK